EVSHGRIDLTRQSIGAAPGDEHIGINPTKDIRHRHPRDERCNRVGLVDLDAGLQVRAVVVGQVIAIAGARQIGAFSDEEVAVAGRVGARQVVGEGAAVVNVGVVPAGEVGLRGRAGVGDDRRGLVDLEVGAVDGGGSVAGDIGAAVGGDVHAQAFTAGRLGLPVVGQVEGSVAGRVDARQVVGDRELVDNVGLVPASQVGIRGRTLVGDDRRGLVDLDRPKRSGGS